mmetsp:Transcript_22451/g.56741  ORF Transcript_22451/g.56741 Transcript_22451/m.56741 type:complete len:367 (+) Transcript_22451:198-1298(+)
MSSGSSGSSTSAAKVHPIEPQDDPSAGSSPPPAVPVVVMSQQPRPPFVSQQQQQQQRSRLDDRVWFWDWIPDNRGQRLARSRDAVRWRNILLAATGTYLVICVLLTTVLYASRRSVSVLLFNAMQGVLVLAGPGICCLRIWFYGMLGSFGGYAAVTGIILLYALLITFAQSNGAFLLLHGSMIVVMDGPFLLIYAKAMQVFYKEWHLASGSCNRSRSPGVSEVVIVHLSNEGPGIQPGITAARRSGTIAGSGGNLQTGAPAHVQPTTVVQMGPIGAVGSAANAIPVQISGGPVQVGNVLPEGLSSTTTVSPLGEGESACPICLTHRRNVAVVPCGHLICAVCQPQIRHNQCPMCRTRIRGFQKLYL